MNKSVYQLGVDSPLRIRQIIGSTDWGLYLRKGFTHLSTHNCQYSAWQAGQELIKRAEAVRLECE